MLIAEAERAEGQECKGNGVDRDQLHSGNHENPFQVISESERLDDSPILSLTDLSQSSVIGRGSRAPKIW